MPPSAEPRYNGLDPARLLRPGQGQDDKENRRQSVLDVRRDRGPLEPLGSLHVSLRPTASPGELEDLWLDLERRSDCSFFQSWAWIGCWLGRLPGGLAPRVLTVSCGQDVVGLGVLIARRENRHGLTRTRDLYLNETGDPLIDPLGLEYNGILADRRIGKSAMARHCLARLAEQEDVWDELNLGGLDAVAAKAWAEAADAIGLGIRVRARKPCNYVDLADVRRKGGDYLGSLSRFI